MDANTLLFDEYTEAVPTLFKNQNDLVTALLNDKNGPYYNNNDDESTYGKALSRLKTYVSQLLSSTVTRNITEEFKRGLISAITIKLGNKDTAEKIVIEIIKDLRKKNSAPIKTEPKTSPIDEFYNEFYAANYIAIITSKPLEIEAVNNPEKFSLKTALFTDFINTLNNPEKDFKNYRLNFPLDSSATLFWKGFKKMLTKYLKKNIENELFFENLYRRFVLKVDTIEQIKKEAGYRESHLEEIANEVLTQLNSNSNILVFVSETPIYSIPLVALNPAEAKNSRLYAILDGDDTTSLYKYPLEEIFLWRLFFWDKLKTKAFRNRSVLFTSIFDSQENSD